MVLRQRIYELAAAESVAVAASVPTLRLVQIPGEHAGRFSVAVTPTHRLIFEAVVDGAVPTSPSGDVDQSLIKSIRIVAVQASDDD